MKIAGSASYVHVTTRVGRLVAQLVGVHRFDLGQNLSLYADPGVLYVFDHAGRLLLAPEVVELRDAQRQRDNPALAAHGTH